MFRTLIAVAVAVAAAAAVIAEARPTRGAGAAELTGPYIGSYTAHLTVQQARARGDSRLAGRFTLVLRKNGTYTTSNPLDGSGRGRLRALSGRRLRFSHDSGCLTGGFERPGGGIYRWSIDGRRLTLRLVTEGPCTGRTQTLTYPVWVRR